MLKNEKFNRDFIFWEEFIAPGQDGDLDDLIFFDEEYPGPSER